MQRLERVSIVVVMAFIFLIAVTSLGFAQTATAPGTTTMPGTMNPNTQIGPGLGQPGVTPPSPNLGQMPSTTLPSVNPNVTPNSTLPNSTPNVNPNVNPNTNKFPYTPNQNVPSPNVSPTPAPNATNPNLTPGVTQPNPMGSQSPYGGGVGTGTGTGTYGTYGSRGR